MTSISKNGYIDKLDDIVNKYNKTFHSTIKMKPVDVKSSSYIDFWIENNDKDAKFQVCGHVRMWKYKTIFAKDFVSNRSKENFSLKRLKRLCRGPMS